jgi:hypothetical protein
MPQNDTMTVPMRADPHGHARAALHDLRPGIATGPADPAPVPSPWLENRNDAVDVEAVAVCLAQAWVPYIIR